MRRIGQIVLTGAALLAAPHVYAQVPDAAQQADIVILGEIHDNADHHRVQAEWIAEVTPTAVVFEMLRPSEAAALSAVPRDAQALTDTLATAHWSNITDYVGVMLASDAVLLGAAELPDHVRASVSLGAAEVFGADAASYGLSDPVEPEDLKTRKTLQFQAHCEAMPLEMMGGMVEAQRFRDAAFARATLDALAKFGAPVVLVTGNGHARKDWGVPSYLARVAPDTAVVSLGQSEDGQAPNGPFDEIRDAPAPKRGDPCTAFK